MYMNLLKLECSEKFAVYEKSIHSKCVFQAMGTHRWRKIAFRTVSFGMIEPSISLCIFSPKESQFAMRFSIALSFGSCSLWSDHICGSIEDSQQ